MRSVVQRVRAASVRVDGREVAAIGRGLVAFVGVEATDTEQDAEALATRLGGLRLFEGDDGRIRYNTGEAGGALLLVPNFTVVASLRRGRRPDFGGAAPPEQARALFDRLLAQLAARYPDVTIASGVFGAHMEVMVQNDGPVTLVVDTRAPGR